MLSISRTLKSSRRAALSVKARADLEDAEERLAKALGAGAGADEIRALEQDVEDCRERLARVPFLDDLDLRYRNRVSVSIPMARAVMFCLMDVSGSMDEGKGSGQALLHAAVPVPVAQVRARRSGVHPPYRQRRGSRRTHLLLRPEERRHHRAVGAGADARDPGKALPAQRLERLRGPGQRRRFIRRRRGQERALPGRAPAAGHALLRLHRGAGLAGGAQEQPVGRVRTEAGAAFRDAADLRSRGDLPVFHDLFKKETV